MIKPTTARPIMTRWPMVKPASAELTRPRAELSVSLLNGRRATS
jgi:hypothetical protein